MSKLLNVKKIDLFAFKLSGTIWSIYLIASNNIRFFLEDSTGEQNIDLGRYKGSKNLKNLYITNQ